MFGAVHEWILQIIWKWISNLRMLAVTENLIFVYYLMFLLYRSITLKVFCISCFVENRSTINIWYEILKFGSDRNCIWINVANNLYIFLTLKNACIYDIVDIVINEIPSIYYHFDLQIIIFIPIFETLF